MYSDIHEEEEECCHLNDCKDELEDEVRQLRVRRILTVISIVFVFLICALILSLTVLHDLQARAAEHAGWEEFSCVYGNTTCQALLCPAGMVWREGVCEVLPGFTCCTTCTHHYSCHATLHSSIRCCYAEGVVPGAYKQACRQGYLWVSWKKKCLRRS